MELMPINVIEIHNFTNMNKSLRFFKKCSKWIIYYNMIMWIIHANYRPWTIVTVTLLIEHFVWKHLEGSLSNAINFSVNAGFVGGGRLPISLLSMETTTDTVGLSWANSCTHNNPTCMHLKISISKQGLYIMGFINAIALSAFHNFHAWKSENKIEIITTNTKNYERTKSNGHLKKKTMRQLNDLQVLKGFGTAHHYESWCFFFH